MCIECCDLLTPTGRGRADAAPDAERYTFRLILLDRRLRDRLRSIHRLRRDDVTYNLYIVITCMYKVEGARGATQTVYCNTIVHTSAERSPPAQLRTRSGPAASVLRPRERTVAQAGRRRCCRSRCPSCRPAGDMQYVRKRPEAGQWAPHERALQLPALLAAIAPAAPEPSIDTDDTAQLRACVRHGGSHARPPRRAVMRRCARLNS
jgi:hypothetical protein